MLSSITSPRQVKIGDAAAFVGTTPRAIRHYHAIGLLPEPERGGDGRRRYGYDEIIRLLWIRKMADAGVALDDVRDAFADAAPAGADGESSSGDVADVLARLEQNLVAQEAELRRQRAAVERMRTRGSRLGLLDDLVSRRLEGLPEGSLRQADLDTLLVTERIFSPLGAAVQAGRFVALATTPGLREESDRVDAAEEALDDTVAVDDPRVAQVAEQRHVFELALHAAMENSGAAQEDDALFDAWDELHPADEPACTASSPARGREPRTVVEAVGMMPYDFSPARVRCMELALELSMETSVAEAPAPEAPAP
ncbi:predicted transcriptional regulator [Sanguibacter keddieii DSM 10542]|uniref:Predicted transcriptional regulator n=1 Tax=Sanguibacter keddieii (strain ATCC 51767 / DSM 10542 / NCFB 3025 / ST-74) TaxID=446469 RepID=D1BHU8_SANKS|nr:MerR family transcriptional regulator [Sanguibacter keddieii]ACZ22018.1 predicted transcriptional regulator [Sanguibacter keddieii DSM 10542]